MPKVFVSHKHINQEIAEALVDFIVATLQIERDQVRCTSTPGSQLPFGKPIEVQLQSDLNQANAIFALLTEESRNAHWVLFELGAAWALGKTIVPILAPGISVNELPGPLPNYPCVVIGKPNATSEMIDAINQVARELGIRTIIDGNAHRKLDVFMQKFVPSINSIKTEVPQAIQAKLFLLSNDVFLLYAHTEPSGIRLDDPQFILDRDEAILQELGINLGQSLHILNSDDAQKTLKKLNAIISVKYPTHRRFFAIGWDLAMAVQSQDMQKTKECLELIDYEERPENLDGIEDYVQLFIKVRTYFENALLI